MKKVSTKTRILALILAALLGISVGCAPADSSTVSAPPTDNGGA